MKIKTDSLLVSYLGVTRYIADTERDCCYVRRVGNGGAIDEDRAHLMAASPQLLAACERALLAMGTAGANADLTHPLRAAWEECRAAIAAAEGL